MKYTNLKEAAYKDVEALLPPELLKRFEKKELFGGVCSLADELVGAVAWRKDEEEKAGEVLSIFVKPEARRLGAGSFLVSNIAREMIHEKCKEIRFTYSEYGDRTALTPFFNEIGYETEVSMIPLGRMTLWELNDAMIKKGITKVAGDAACLYEIEKTERMKLREELSRVSGQDINSYDKELPGTYVVTDGSKIKAALFVSEEKSGILSLDYLYGNGSPKDIASIMKTAVMRLLTHYDRETVCEMLLATEAGRNLYEGMFGEAEYSYRVASCSQAFGVL